MPDIHAYLVFNGNCAEAMRFYERALGDGGLLMASDDMPGADYKGMSGFGVSLTYQNAADAKRAFDALSEGAQVTMPFQKTFWSEGFGMLTDRFGVPWMANTAAPNQ